LLAGEKNKISERFSSRYMVYVMLPMPPISGKKS
jgi:hypothetical protein